RYLQKDSYLEQLYENTPNRYVQPSEWRALAKAIKEGRMLRNISTVALPPTGRSALVIDASTGVEPHFTLDNLQPCVSRVVQRLGDSNEGSEVLHTALDISPFSHIAMASTLQKFSDE